MYAEVYFAFNFFIDFILLYAGCAFCAAARGKMMPLAALFGAAYAAACAYIVPLGRFALPAALCMAALSIDHPNMRKCLKLTAFLYLTSFFLGGLGTGLLFALGRQGYLDSKSIGALFALLGAATLTILLRRILSLRLPSAQICMRITGKTRSHLIRAVIDSGNLLCDPVTLLPVIAASDRALFADLTPLNRQLPFHSVGADGFLELHRAGKIEYFNGRRFVPLPDACIGCASAPPCRFPALVPYRLIHHI